jgi:hypothetical protein
MGSIILLALGASVFPTLLACVAVMIARPEPRLLLLAFYAGALVTSLTAGILVLAAFRHGDAVLGSTDSTPHPVISIIAGLASLLFAWLLASARGAAIIGRLRVERGRHRKPKREKGSSWVERRLSRASAGIGFVVGAVINLPGPFYLLALGDIARGGYSTARQLGLIVLFNAIMFLLLEVPLVGYLIQPTSTAERVAAVSLWLNANGLRITGWLVGVFGTGVLVQGIAAFVG